MVSLLPQPSCATATVRTFASARTERVFVNAILQVDIVSHGKKYSPKVCITSVGRSEEDPTPMVDIQVIIPLAHCHLRLDLSLRLYAQGVFCISSL